MPDYDPSNPPEEGFQGIEHSSIDHEELPKPKFNEELRKFGEKPLEPPAVTIKKLSALSLTALICAVIVPPVGVLLGVISYGLTYNKVNFRSKHCSVAAIIIGLLMTFAIVILYNNFRFPVL